MRNVFLLTAVLSCVSPVVAQGETPAPISQKATPSTSRRTEPVPVHGTQAASSAVLPASTPIVTLNGVCDHTPRNASKSCKTVITRGQLDSMMDTASSDATLAARQEFAVRYARTLAAAAVAEREHLDRDPAIAQTIQGKEEQARKELLAAALYSKLTQQAENVPEMVTRKYYTEHQADFDVVDLRCLSIPKTGAAESGQLLDADKTKSKADELRKRALAGDDFQQLQQDVYKDLGIKAGLPSTRLNTMRRRNLTQEEQKFFEFKPGEVSDVLVLPAAFVIFKLESKTTLPVAAVKKEINSILQAERLRKELQEIAKDVKADFNLNYLNMPTAPELFPIPVLSRTAGRPGKGPDRRSRLMSGARRGTSTQMPNTAIGPNQPN